MEAASGSYFLERLDRMRGLDPEQAPLWGSMSPQHMVEHIVGSWRISNGRARVRTVLPADEIERRREFLYSDRPYERNIQNPVFQGKAPSLRKASLSDAIDQLEDEMKAFFEYHEANPDAVETHPVFGDLDYDGWMTFQTKHMGHHLAQFGIS